jgi:sugar transport system permease protein
MAGNFLHRSSPLRAILSRAMLEIVLVGLCMYLAFTAKNFFTLDNMMNVLRSISEQALIAFGMTMVIVAGEIDLSVASMAALSGCLVAWLARAGVPVPLAIVAALAAGAASGGFTGFMRSRFSVPSFITTLALFSSLRGAAERLTGGFPISFFPSWYSFLGSGYVFGVPFPAILFLLTFGGVYFLMNYTTFGRSVYAVGGNAEAARLSGIGVAKVRILVLALTGILTAASGVMLSARMMNGDPTAAKGWELEVIAAVIIGGTSLMGGAGSVWGTLIGVIFIGVIANGMTLLNVSPYSQHIVQGVLILAAVLVNQVQRAKLQ